MMQDIFWLVIVGVLTLLGLLYIHLLGDGGEEAGS